MARSVRMNRMNDERFQRIAKALADPSRLAILERVAQSEEVPCRALVEDLPITQATVSHHTRELSQAGLITMRREGKCGFWRMVPGSLEAYRVELERRLKPAMVGVARNGRSNGQLV